MDASFQVLKYYIRAHYETPRSVYSVMISAILALYPAFHQVYARCPLRDQVVIMLKSHK